MIELNLNQITFISSYIEEGGLKYEPLREELLDHMCCMVEENMHEGLPFHQACDQVFNIFGKDGMEEIEQQTFHLLNQKSQLMKKVSFVALALMLCTFTVVYALQMDPPNSKPLADEFEITSGFGKRMHPIIRQKKMHKGIDFRAPIGTPVHATAAGEVIAVERKKTGYGFFVKIKHDNSFTTVYAQLSKINVKVGQEVKQGELIAETGNSGMSTAPHLHYEVHKDGNAVDPSLYFGP